MFKNECDQAIDLILLIINSNLYLVVRVKNNNLIAF